MSKLTPQKYSTTKGVIKINCYHVHLSKELVKQANLSEDDELKIYAKRNKIIIEKGK